MNTFIAVAAFVISASVALNIVATHRDAELMHTASLYEQCVKAEYGMTPRPIVLALDAICTWLRR
jgi:hypothetical protein